MSHLTKLQATSAIHSLYRCDCGNEEEFEDLEVEDEETTSCSSLNCLYNEHSFVGERFGHLTILYCKDSYKESPEDYLYMCQCDCGQQYEVKASVFMRPEAKTTSYHCGCDAVGCNTEVPIEERFLTGIWRNIKNELPEDSEWQQKDTFIQWALSHSYQLGKFPILTDPSKPLAPDNVRFKYPIESESGILSVYSTHQIKGEKKTLQQWAFDYAMSVETLYSRIQEDWEIETALYTPDPKKPEYLSIILFRLMSLGFILRPHKDTVTGKSQTYTTFVPNYETVQNSELGRAINLIEASYSEKYDKENGRKLPKGSSFTFKINGDLFEVIDKLYVSFVGIYYRHKASNAEDIEGIENIESYLDFYTEVIKAF